MLELQRYSWRGAVLQCPRHIRVRTYVMPSFAIQDCLYCFHDVGRFAPRGAAALWGLPVLLISYCPNPVSTQTPHAQQLLAQDAALEKAASRLGRSAPGCEQLREPSSTLCCEH